MDASPSPKSQPVPDPMGAMSPASEVSPHTPLPPNQSNPSHTTSNTRTAPAPAPASASLSASEQQTAAVAPSSSISKPEYFPPTPASPTSPHTTSSTVLPPSGPPPTTTGTSIRFQMDDPNMGTTTIMGNSENHNNNNNSNGNSIYTPGYHATAAAAHHGRSASSASGASSAGESRKSSVASVSFRAPVGAGLPQGRTRRTDGKRIREGSPVHGRFEQRVAFNSLGITKRGIPTCMLSVKHHGWHATRTSRLVMVGVDAHTYSNGALEWVLREYVDDGDTVVCVRVIEKELRAAVMSDKNYEDEARVQMNKIKEMSKGGRAIEIILELAVGKLNESFQKLIQMYHPSMLVVGTKGRSLGGFQGLMNARNSFSKYCLQYSPIPVVVVRPDASRTSKRVKRSQDPEKQTYSRMLGYNNGAHESDQVPTGLDVMEANISADEEAHRVAAAIGLPALFDPTLKPLKSLPGRRKSSLSMTSNASSPPPSPLGRGATDSDKMSESGRTDSVAATSDAGSADEMEESDDDDDDEEGGFDVRTGDEIRASLARGERTRSSAGSELASGDEEEDEDESEGEDGAQTSAKKKPTLIRVASAAQQGLEDSKKKEKLHEMEVGEAAALLKAGPGADEEDEDDE